MTAEDIFFLFDPSIIIGLVVTLIICLFSLILVWYNWNNPLGWITAAAIVFGIYRGIKSWGIW